MKYGKDFGAMESNDKHPPELLEEVIQDVEEM